MKITVDIQDRVWADFCLFVESDHGPHCQCRTRGFKDPDAALSALIAMSLIEHKRTEFKSTLLEILMKEFGLPDNADDFEKATSKLNALQVVAIFGKLAEIDLKLKDFVKDLAEQYGIGDLLK